MPVLAQPRAKAISIAANAGHHIALWALPKAPGTGIVRRMLSLALLRHAKSSWDDPALDDFERPLNERGRQTAPLMGRLLAAAKFVPDVVLCSTSKRTRQTLEHVMPHLTPSPRDVTFEDELYLASPDGILGCVRRVDAAARKVLVIGHNPGMHMLACRLAASGDAGEVKRLCDKFPTGALAIYSFPQESFSALDPETGHLDTYMTPKDRR